MKYWRYWKSVWICIHFIFQDGKIGAVQLYTFWKNDSNWKMCSKKYDRKTWHGKNGKKKIVCWLAWKLLGAVNFAILIWIGNILNPFFAAHSNVSHKFKKKNTFIEWSFRNNSLHIRIVPQNGLIICVTSSATETAASVFWICTIFAFHFWCSINLVHNSRIPSESLTKCKLIWFVILLERNCEMHFVYERHLTSADTSMSRVIW